MPVPDALPVGAQLREARERQGLPLEGIAHSLRIPVRILRALEEGESISLPADVYVRGFVRQYAEVLGLDSVPLLRAFAAERARRPPSPAVFPWMTHARERHPSWEFVRPRTLAIAGSALGFSAVLLYVALQVRTYTRPPRLDVYEPPYDLEIRGSSVTVRGRTDATAELSINGEQTVVREDGSFEEAIGVREGVNTLRIAATSIGGRETVVTREVLLRPATAPSPATSQTSASEAGSGPFTLTVRADDGEPVWILLSVDDQVAFRGLLLPGSERTVSGERVAVTSGKAARTRIRIGDEDRGVLRDVPGVVREILFTRNPRTGRIEPHELTKVPRE